MSLTYLFDTNTHTIKSSIKMLTFCLAPLLELNVLDICSDLVPKLLILGAPWRPAGPKMALENR